MTSREKLLVAKMLLFLGSNYDTSCGRRDWYRWAKWLAHDASGWWYAYGSKPLRGAETDKSELRLDAWHISPAYDSYSNYSPNERLYSQIGRSEQFPVPWDESLIDLNTWLENDDDNVV